MKGILAMENNANREEIERLLALGRMDLEAGYPEYAREYFEKVLAIDPANEKARKAIARIEEMLSRKKSTMPIDKEAYHAELEAEMAKEIAEAKRRWAERRAKLGEVPLQLGQCPECGSLNTQYRKELSPIVKFAQIMIWPVGYLIDPFVPEIWHCNFCGAVWRVKKL